MVRFKLYVLDCEMLSFGQACSITIPMNINPQRKIALKTTHLLKSSREKIIAMALWRKLKHVPVTKIVTGNLKRFLQFVVNDIGLFFCRRHLTRVEK